jgi:mono/diheme cytochrome c family protein
MSASHDDAHAHAGPEPVEVTNPLLWTVFLLGASLVLVWWFFHWLASGRVEGRRSDMIPQVGRSTMAVEPDHKKLAADRSQDVIDHGALLYAKNCASCHGTNGDNPPSISGTPPRNFRADAFKNPLGGGPYGLFVVVTRGFGSMPAFPSLSATDRYAVVQFVRETMVKPSNAKNYVANDADSVLKQIPPPGSAAAVDQVARNLVEIKAPLLPLLAGISDEEAQKAAFLSKWLEQARREAGDRPVVSTGVQQLIELSADHLGLIEVVHQSVVKDDKARFTALLAGSDGSGAVHPYFSLLGEDHLVALFQFLKNLGGR